jgi:hypothetical protein
LTFQLAAEDDYRADIAVPAGSGEINGAWQLKDKKFAVRDNAGATAGIMFLASSGGWTTSGLTMAEYIFFDAGTANGPFAEGDTVTGGTSNATATVHRVILHAGAWDGSAAGYITLTGVANGPFQNNEALKVGANTVGTADGVNTTFAFSAGGHYQFVNHNFFGGSDTYRAYGCNGIDPAFEIDENEVVAPILFAASAITGQPPANTPKYIEEHRNYLFLSFPGGSVQHSVAGTPMTFNGFLGAAEFGMGDEVTGLNSMTGPVLVISSERQTRALFGKSTSDWEIKIIGEKSGAKNYSAQKLDTVYALNDLGITSLARTDAYGDFVGALVCHAVHTLVNEKKSLITTSTVNRETNQYRIYFSDNTALVIYAPSGMDNSRTKYRKMPIVQFGFLKYDQPVNKIWNSEDENGAEVTFFSSDDGFVYQDQKGSNFDGDDITSYCRLHFNNVGSPGMRKRFRMAELELDAQVNIDLKFTAELSYSSADVSSSISTLTVAGGGGVWGSVDWNNFQWSSQSLSSAMAKLTGTGTNIGFVVYNKSNTAKPFTLQGITLHYENRRMVR